MKGKFYYVLILTFLIYPSGQGSVFAQQINFNPRDAIIVSTLNQVQERDAAIRDSIKEAQLKLVESSIPVKKRRGDAAPEKAVKKNGGFLKGLSRKAHPYVTTSITHNDNINGAPEKKSDFIYSIVPGVKANYFFPNSTLNLDLHVNNLFNHKHPLDNDQSLSFGVLNNINLGPYVLSLSDTYFSNYIAGPAMGVKVDDFNFFWGNDFGVSLGRSFNRLGMQAGYERSDVVNKRKFNLSDHVGESFSFSQYLKLGRKSRVMFEYNHGRSIYGRAEESNVNSDKYALSATTVLSSKLSVLAKAGYTGNEGKADADSRDMTFEQNLGYRVSDRTNLSLDVRQLISRPQEDSSNTFTKSFTLSGNHRLAFNPKINLSLSYGLEFAKTPNISFDTGHTDTYTFGCGLSYAFRQWIDFSLDYQREKTDSDFSDDYHNNQIIFKTQAKF